MLGRLLLFLFVLILAGTAAAHADTHTAASCSQTDVQAAMTAASDGDTVNIPGCGCGSATWSSPIRISKSVTIKGQGAANTCIQNNGFITVTGVNNWRITGIKWKNAGGGTPVDVTSGIMYNGTPITGWTIDNNAFDGYGNGTLQIRNGSTGLIANNLFVNTNASDSIIYVYGRDNTDWAAASPIGTSKTVFIEDNKFVTATNASNHAILGQWGASYVFRCNEIGYTGSGTYKDAIDAHGYGHGTYRRATRTYEIYGNYLHNDNYNYRSVNLRGGTGRVFANRWTNGNTFINLTDYRMISTGQSMAYPTNVNDCRSNSANWPSSSQTTGCASNEGYACCDQIGRIQDIVGSRQAGLPLYLWNNETESGAAIRVNADGQYIVKNRDFYVDIVPAGYTPYTYPHPSRGLAATTMCLTDGNSQAKTGIKFWAGGAPTQTKPSPPKSLRVD
jgi:hypothetical protein